MARVYYVSSYFWDRALDSGIISDKEAISFKTSPTVRRGQPQGKGGYASWQWGARGRLGRGFQEWPGVLCIGDSGNGRLAGGCGRYEGVQLGALHAQHGQTAA